MKPTYSVIVPVFNEELVIHECYRRLTDVMKQTASPYELIFVNDGSKDQTDPILRQYHQQDNCVVLIDFSRNFGHQSAITAGMDYAKGDAVIIIDADLQDPPEAILQMIALWQQGFEVVYGKRSHREGETFFKKLTAKMYYRLLKRMTDVNIPVDTGDFRLMDRKVIDAMKTLQEKNRYVRGLVSWVGFKQIGLEYPRDPRLAGETKYPFRNMIKLATDGIVSFSYKPLRIATFVGFLFSALSFIYLVYVLFLKLFTDKPMSSGWASLIGVLLFSQGILLIVLGMIGEYIGRIYEEVKNRPNYLIREIVENEDKGDGR